MNLLLLSPTDLVNDNQAVIKGRQLQHILQVHQSQVGDALAVGLINGFMGKGYISRLSTEQAIIEFQLDTPPPAKLPITLLLALPRPKMLRRILQTIATMGVNKLILINSYKVEKSFWQTPFLMPENIQQQLLLGLEQAKDTVLPEVQLVKRFKPFVEDQLPALIKDSQNLIAHLGNYRQCPSLPQQSTTLAIGPEGGWINYEVDKLQQIGFTPVQLGQRILRVETAVAAFLTKLYY
ncbi:16S rRNA (uracil(1498)-N(3))-methyltransferase [Entomomonas asaccharolytica]|uniref:Ribosomal RNA small subunit methyltransferase E n=1 Tax=Entomomonas asaccharolytica TaxID=2785331 RepID=A0A974RWI3_9GAMM|nr:16S rRNA (uracil(1498)-N(3))-methyltransferase [Entomomonas asaccharolytica]QQP85233.1 16S rRNA (uracil(1498)-N(3))-methyltransferase [Entomomonas asaccharolytica]